jgi:hypothetical protein
VLLFFYFIVRHYQNDKRGRAERPKTPKLIKDFATLVGIDCAASQLIIIPQFPPQ